MLTEEREIQKAEIDAMFQPVHGFLFSVGCGVSLGDIVRSAKIAESQLLDLGVLKDLQRFVFLAPQVEC